MFFLILFFGLFPNREIIVVPQGESVLVPITVENFKDLNLNAKLNTFDMPMVLRHDSVFVLVSVDLGMKKGNYTLKFYLGNKTIGSFQVKVEKVIFPSKYYKSGYKNKTSPNDTVAKKLWKRYEKLISYPSEERYAHIEMLTDPLSQMVVTSPFGKKRIYTNRINLHKGSDLRAAPCTKVFSVAYGKVVWAEQDTLPANGVTIVIDVGGNIRFFYLHLSEVLVKTGDMVNAGQVIGYSGSTGNSDAPHLHWEVRVGSFSVDPIKFLSVFR